jgi:hypothetical protein
MPNSEEFSGLPTPAEALEDEVANLREGDLVYAIETTPVNLQDEIHDAVSVIAANDQPLAERLWEDIMIGAKADQRLVDWLIELNRLQHQIAIHPEVSSRIIELQQEIEARQNEIDKVEY